MNRSFVISTIALTALSSACAFHHGAFMSMDVGITPGGSQDIGFARGVIANGQIPDQEQFTAEGLFSEHDLPLSGEACAELICPRAAATIHRPADGADKVLVQLGFGSNIDGATFERSNQDLALLIDTSGSMSGDPLQTSKLGMSALVEAMGPNDRVSLIEFGSSARVLASAEFMTERNKERLLRKIERLSTNGSTDMESGMRKAYSELESAFDGSQRLMIFSDAQPNTGVVGESEFVQLVRENADKGIGTTFFGIGGHLGTELADVISKVRLGSFHFLSEESVDRLFVDELDYLVTPIATDLEVTMSGLADAPLGDEVFGAPVDGDSVAFGASTLFLSSRKGGMGATFDVIPDGPVSLGTMSVSYLPIGASEPVETSVSVRWDGGTFDGDADDVGVLKMDALVHQYKALVAAAEFCDESRSQEDAVASIDFAIGALEEVDAILESEANAEEVALLEALRELVNAEEASCAPADQAWY